MFSSLVPSFLGGGVFNDRTANAIFAVVRVFSIADAAGHPQHASAVGWTISLTCCRVFCLRLVYSTFVLANGGC